MKLEARSELQKSLHPCLSFLGVLAACLGLIESLSELPQCPALLPTLGTQVLLGEELALGGILDSPDPT